MQANVRNLLYLFLIFFLSFFISNSYYFESSSLESAIVKLGYINFPEHDSIYKLTHVNAWSLNFQLDNQSFCSCGQNSKRKARNEVQ